MRDPKSKRRLIAVGCASALALTGGAVAANAAGVLGGEDAAEGPDRAITGSALEKASAAALDKVGQGKVTGTEAGDEESAYEVEVTKSNGSQVDVQLDKSFKVVSTEDEGREGTEAGEDESSPEGADDAGDESGPEGADDAADEGPDANPDEPGHQDAGE
ncbi:MAG: hypothetical protein JWM86_989 [Thermoleophilia bacterium]|nr:hypothetical protein [Thermoleophilia bacterium]